MPPSELAPGEVVLGETVISDQPVATGAEESPTFVLPPALPAPEAVAAVEVDPDRPPGARDGMFQKITFQGTSLAGGRSADAFGMNDLELKTVLALPIPSRKYPLIITPRFAAHFLEGPEISDLPPRVYDASTQFRWMYRISPQWGLDAAVTPGWYSDFEQSSSKALRVTGYGAVAYTCSPTTKLVLGAAYLDRENLNVLPVGGVIWKPNPDLAFDLVAPRPQISRRIYWDGASGDTVQDWLYLAGELGGGTWAIQRANASEDTFTYNDYRVLLGLERKVIGGLGGWLEVGYVFGREIEYGSHTPTVDPPGTVLLRAGATY